MIGCPGHVLRIWIMIGFLSFLQEVVTQVPYFGLQNVIYPTPGGSYASPFPGTIVSDFNPYYREPYLLHRPFVGPYSETLSPRYQRGYYGSAGPGIRSSFGDQYGGYRRRSRARIIHDREKHYRKKAQIHHAVKKQKIKAINAGIFPAVYPHPKIQRHWERKAKKRAKFKGMIPKAKSFNGILKGTSLNVAF